MKVIILAAGYATRLYPLTKDKPKSLLEVKGRPLLDYTLESLNKVEEIDNIYVVTNDKFYNNLLEWSKKTNSSKGLEIINDRTKNNGERLGGVGNLAGVLKEKNIDEDFIVVLGDIYSDLDYKKIISFFKSKHNFVVGLTKVDFVEEGKKFGVIELGEENEIISYEEKPEKPKSNLISNGIYVFPKDLIGEICEYVEKDLPKEGPAYLIDYFMKFGKVYGYVFNADWYDIGDLDTYNKINKD